MEREADRTAATSESECSLHLAASFLPVNYQIPQPHTTTLLLLLPPTNCSLVHSSKLASTAL